MNGIRAAKYAVKAAYLLVWLFTLIVVAGPIIGAVSPQLMTQKPLGLGVNIQAIQPQVKQIFDSSSAVGSHQLEVPAFNNWPLAGSASLFLTVMANGQTLYQTPPANLRLGAFQSGNLTIPFDISSSLYSQLQGQSVAIGGSMSMSEGRFWTITVSLSK